MKNVLITGSARRIGRVLAIEFAKKGYNLFLHYNDSQERALITKKEIEEYGVNVVLVKADLRNENHIEHLFKDLNNYNIDILVNNAAIYPEQKPLNELELQDWNDTINLNLRSVFLMSKFFAEQINNKGKIINIGSLGAFHIWKKRIIYNTAKAGVIQLTKALAIELAPNISVNSVSPGSIFINNDEPSEHITLKESSIPFGRFGKPEEVFEAVYFFATCSNFITGQNINVDGGFGLI